MTGFDSITLDGKTFALVPIEQLENASGSLEVLTDIIVADNVKAKIELGEETFPMELGEELTAAYQANRSPISVWRNYRGLTQQKLADKINKSREYVAALESGKKQGSIKTIKDIATALSIDLDDLV